ncbi:MAG: hypothetical protein TEF_06565 [Rhizobiales bacterium NRL2]|jgi:hypothetical protein|nr:MAG: hypothetical protein TEF_06565 [Rhizobiales bacterium NRL2]
MSLQSEIAPYVDALKGRKTPVSPYEAISYINAVVEAAERRPAKGGIALNETAKTQCLAQIDESLQTIAQAAVDIMNAAETVMKDAGTDAAVRQRCMDMLTACGFQDLVSQRLLIVRQHLSETAGSNGTRTSLNATAAREPHADDALLHGPSTGKEAMDQAAIDALLND